MSLEYLGKLSMAVAETLGRTGWGNWQCIQHVVVTALGGKSDVSCTTPK